MVVLWLFYFDCTTVACLPPIRGLEKCTVIGHSPHVSCLCSLSCLKPKVLPKGILFSACDWWKAVNCGTSHIDSTKAVVYVIPSGLLGYASLHLGYIPYTTASLGSIYHLRMLWCSCCYFLLLLEAGSSISCFGDFIRIYSSNHETY